MKTTTELYNKGYRFLAASINGAGKCCSYIVKYKRRKIYGYWDYQLNKYIEEIAK